MKDEITERILSEKSTDSNTDENADFSWKHALVMLTAAFGIWTLLGVTVGWSKSVPPSKLSAIDAIATGMIALMVAIFLRAVLLRLSFVSDSTDELWFILLLWGLMLVVGGVLAALVLWGPPDLAEILRGSTV